MSELCLLAPAKLNLFLHILGKRTDGYHQLQTVMQFVDCADILHLSTREDGDIKLQCEPELPVKTPANLIYKAARLLQLEAQSTKGANIKLIKKLPLGAGIGGGSSDAATTLIGLNTLWNIHLPMFKLAQIGEQLGADVPFFVFGHAAWAEGKGEQLTPIELPQNWFIIIIPACHVSTAEIFSHRQLTRNTTAIKMADFLAGRGETTNDCEQLVRKIYPEVDKAYQWLSQFGNARLTGTGACIFLETDDKEHADSILAQLPVGLQGFVVKGINKSPLHQQLNLLH